MEQLLGIAEVGNHHSLMETPQPEEVVAVVDCTAEAEAELVGRIAVAEPVAGIVAVVDSSVGFVVVIEVDFQVEYCVVHSTCPILLSAY